MIKYDYWLQDEDTEDYNDYEDVTPTPAPVPATAAPAKFEKSRFAIDGRKPKVKSNLKAKLRNKKFGGNFNNFDNDNENNGRNFNGGGFRNQFRQRGRSSFTNFGRQTTTTTEEPFYGPDVKPDGREPRVKSDLRAEIPRAPQPETTTELPEIEVEEEAFLESFFASPSSPKPFIFRGTPAPTANRFDRFNLKKQNDFGGEPDLFGSATTVKSFFVPTPKPSFAGISQTPEILTLGLKSSNEVTESVGPADHQLFDQGWIH